MYVVVKVVPRIEKNISSIGHLTRNPEISFTVSGTKCTIIK